MINPFDTTETPLSEPETIVAGSYLAWRRDLEITDELVTISYRLFPLAGGSSIDINGSYVLSGTWLFEVLSATSATWATGEYRWDLIATRTSDSEEKCLETGRLTIFATTDDRRTHAEIMVTKIESVLSGRADHDIESYSIKSRSISRMSVSELIKWRDYYLDEIARTGGSVTQSSVAKSNTVRVRFVS